MTPTEGKYIVRSAMRVPRRSGMCEARNHGKSSQAEAAMVARACGARAARSKWIAKQRSTSSRSSERALRGSLSRVTIGMQSYEYSTQKVRGASSSPA